MPCFLSLSSWPPMAAKTGFLLSADSGKEEKGINSCEDGKISEGGGGYNRNKPMNLVVMPPQMQPESLIPLFMVPSRLSPSGILNSPRFFPHFKLMSADVQREIMNHGSLRHPNIIRFKELVDRFV